MVRLAQLCENRHLKTSESEWRGTSYLFQLKVKSLNCGVFDVSIIVNLVYQVRDGLCGEQGNKVKERKKKRKEKRRKEGKKG